MGRHYDDFETRRNLWYQLIDSDALDLFRQNRTEEGIERIREILGAEVVGEAVFDGEYTI